YYLLATAALHSFPTRRSSDLLSLKLAVTVVLGDTAMDAGEGFRGRRRAAGVTARTRLWSSYPSSQASASGTNASLRKKHGIAVRSEEHTSELQSRSDLVCRLL